MNGLRKSILLLLLALASGGLMSISVQAAENARHGPPAFSDIDLDGDGFVSEDEFNTFRGQRMAERAAEGKNMRGAANAPAFADIDTDGDGQLNTEELAAAQKMRKEQMHTMGEGHGHGKGEGHGKGSGKGKCKGQGACQDMKGKMPTFADFDQDGDGRITEAEFNEGHAKKMSEMAAQGRSMKHAENAPGFTGIDTNDDGEISEDEFAAHQAEHHKKIHQSKEK
jgi:Ca2+-binding EF-hand superfamily protein